MLSPLHIVVAVAVTEGVSAGPKPTVIVFPLGHPFASLIITLYVPEHKPVAIAVVWAAGSSHKKVYGEVPPDVLLASAVPSQLDAQDVGELVVVFASISGSVMATVVV